MAQQKPIKDTRVVSTSVKISVPAFVPYAQYFAERANSTITYCNEVEEMVSRPEMTTIVLAAGHLSIRVTGQAKEKVDGEWKGKLLKKFIRVKGELTPFENRYQIAISDPASIILVE